MNFDAMKVTYNKYSCSISVMSREMMKMDGRDRAECQNWEKRDINVIFRKVLKSLDDKKLIQCFFSNKKGRKKLEMQNFGPVAFLFFFEISFREKLLSKNSDDPTVGSLRDKKESCYTRRGLRVGTGFRKFSQTP